MTDDTATRRYLRIGLITVAAIYFLIMVGGIVRASGAGMGCPDWPTCFGQWIPPTSEAELPSNYHDVYAQRGYADTRFNPIKTWTEYVNRLIGVSIGLLIALTVLSSLRLRSRDPIVFRSSLAVLVLVGFQGWLGSAVVASNLKPAMITAHMITAFLIVCLLIYAVVRSQRQRLIETDLSALPSRLPAILATAMVMTLLQIAMGTQIRESVDVISALFSASDRHLWREEFPTIFYVHRSFSSIILITNGWIAWTIIKRLGFSHWYARFGVTLAALVLGAIAAGVGLERLGFPAIVQPIHLVLANLIFGTQFAMFMIRRYASQAEEPRSGLMHRSKVPA
jgi:cytochrome c oxidase assembly protein subunit 15